MGARRYLDLRARQARRADRARAPCGGGCGEPLCAHVRALALRQSRWRAARRHLPHHAARQFQGMAEDALLPPVLLERRLPGVRVRGAAPPLAAAAGVGALEPRDLQRHRPRALALAGRRGAARACGGCSASPTSDYTIGMCAVLRPEKNHLQLIEALAHLRARGIRRARAADRRRPDAAGDRGARARLGLAGEVLIAGMQQDVRRASRRATRSRSAAPRWRPSRSPRWRRWRSAARWCSRTSAARPRWCAPAPRASSFPRATRARWSSGSPRSPTRACAERWARRRAGGAGALLRGAMVERYEALLQELVDKEAT